MNQINNKLLLIVFFKDKNDSARVERLILGLSGWLPDCAPEIVIICDTFETLNEIRRFTSLKDYVRIMVSPGGGRGKILKEIWGKTSAGFLGYIYGNLSYDKEFLKQIPALLSGNYDLVVGSRLISKISNGFPGLKRFFSENYNLVVKSVLGENPVSDLHCHCKFIKREVFARLMDRIKSNGSFFDTELVIYAKKYGFNIKEIAVESYEQNEGPANIMKYIIEDLSGIIGLRRNLGGRL